MRRVPKFLTIAILALTVGFVSGEVLQSEASAAIATGDCPHEQCAAFGTNPGGEYCESSDLPMRCWIQPASTPGSTPECHQCECGSVDCPTDPPD